MLNEPFQFDGVLEKQKVFTVDQAFGRGHHGVVDHKAATCNTFKKAIVIFPIIFLGNNHDLGREECANIALADRVAPDLSTFPLLFNGCCQLKFRCRAHRRVDLPASSVPAPDQFTHVVSQLRFPFLERDVPQVEYVERPLQRLVEDRRGVCLRGRR